MDEGHHSRTWPRLDPNDQVACHFCDTLHHAPDLEPGESARCQNCGAVLFENGPQSLSRVASYSISALIFTILVHSFPILSMKALGNFTDLTLFESMQVLVHYGDFLLAGLILIFTVIAPIMLTGGLLYIVAPLMIGKALPGAVRLNVWIQRAEPWAMLEVFLLGFIVSLLKLGHIAELHFGIGLWALIALVFCITSALGSMDKRELWDRLELAKYNQQQRSNAKKVSTPENPPPREESLT